MKRTLIIALLAMLCGSLWAAPASMDVFDAKSITGSLDGTREKLDDGWDRLLFLTALQGLCNRKTPSVYILYTKADSYWLDKMTEKNSWMEKTRINRVESLDELYKRHAGVFKGAVVYDPKVPATSCAAATAAGAESLVPLRYDPRPDSLYSRMITDTTGPRLKVKRWLVNPDGSSMFTGSGTIPGTDLASTGSAKCDVYMWAKANYLDKGLCSKEYMGYYTDYYFTGVCNPKSLGNSTLVNLDFQIANKGFVFDLSPWEDEKATDEPQQPLGADYAAFKAILLSAYTQAKGQMIQISGFTPWNTKYTNFGEVGGKHSPVPTEWHHAELLSSYNCYMDADALGSSDMANASVFSKFPMKKKYTQRKPDVTDLKGMGLIDSEGYVKTSNYFCIYVGDYDSAAWLYQHMPTMWEDDKRGQLPLGWAINPTLAQRFAFGMDYIRRTATQYDSFVAGDSGAGYVNPGAFEEPRSISGLPYGGDIWLEHCKKWYDKFDLSITGFVIDGDAPKMSDRLFDAYTVFSPDGLGGQKLPDRTGVYNHIMPYMTMGDGNDFKKAEMIGKGLGNGISFHYLRNVLWTPAKQKDFFTEIKKYSDDVTVLGPYEFFALLKYYYENGQKARSSGKNVFASKSIVITDHSELINGSEITEMFGTEVAAVEKTSVIFAGKPAGFVHYAEFETKAPVTVSRVVLGVRSDEQSLERSISAFRLYAKGTDGKWTELCTKSLEPWPFRLKIKLDVPKPIKATAFRAEFVQPDTETGPRITELEAYEN